MTDIPAFPHKPERKTPAGDNLFVVTPGDEPGMTLRDYFAAKAMQAAFAEMLREKPCEGAAAAIRVSAVIAYQMADAMLKARNAAQ
jgi:NAD(P)-dependent dehydrogenase (short-subunit alcohol dehydrogenase family)